MPEHDTQSLVQIATMLENLIRTVAGLAEEVKEVHKDISGQGGLRTQVELNTSDIRNNDKRITFLEKVIWSMVAFVIFQSIIGLFSIVGWVIYKQVIG